MRRFLALVISAACLAVPAGAALAAVADPAGVLTPAEEQALEQDLRALGPHRFEVAFVQNTSAGPVAEAEQRFKRAGLGPDDGVIVVSMGDRNVGVHLGQGFAARGIGPAAIQRAIASEFAPRARTGDLEGAAAALANSLAQGAPAGRAPAGQAPGFPWWLLLVPVAGGAIWWLSRRRQARSDLAPRLQALQTRNAAILEQALKLEDATQQAAYQAGETAETYRRLGAETGPWLGAAGELGDKLETAEAALKKGDGLQAARLLDEVDSAIGPLEAEVAAATTATAAMADDDQEARAALGEARRRLAALGGRAIRPAITEAITRHLDEAEAKLAAHDPTGALALAIETTSAIDRLEGRKTSQTPPLAWAELPQAAEALARRLAELETAYANERERAATFHLAGEPTLEGRLQDARRSLATPPINLEAAKAAMAEAQTALAHYHDTVEAEADRIAREPKAPMPSFGWGLPPVIFMPGEFGERHFPGGSSGMGGWGDGGGISGGGSWGGDGSSGSGNW